MNTANIINTRSLFELEPDPDPYRFIAQLARLIDDGPWSSHEHPDVIETLILLSLGYNNREIAEIISSVSGRLRGPGYVRSVKNRAAATITQRTDLAMVA